MKFINVKDRLYVNPEKISYIYKNEFIKGTIVYFDSLGRYTLNEDEEKILMSQLKKRGLI